MSKKYRSRNLWRQVQIAKPGPDGLPLRDEGGKPILMYEGQWFSVVSTGADRMRVLPVDSEAFFRQRAEAATAAQKARGKNVTVTPEEIYKLYSGKYTRPSDTYAPPNEPSEFTIVLAKALCVNLSYSRHSGAKQGGPPEVFSDDLSVLLGLDGEADPAPSAIETPTAPEEQPAKKRKGRNAQTEGAVQMSDFIN